MADIRLNLIADISSFKEALNSAVNQAKSTPALVDLRIDKPVWRASVREAKTLLGTSLSTYTTKVVLNTSSAVTQALALRKKLETEIGGLVLSPVVKPTVDYSEVNKLKQAVAVGPGKGQQIADLIGKTKAQGGLNKAALEAIAKELGVSGSGAKELRDSLRALFESAGEDSIAGLEEGIKKAYQTGKTAANDFSQGFKDFLGIASPAKLFKKFGEFCVEGLANGLLRIDYAAKNAAKDFGVNFTSQLDKEVQQVGIEKKGFQLGKQFGDAFGDSVALTIRGAIDTALATAMVKGGIGAVLGGGKSAIGAIPDALGETGGIAKRSAVLIGQIIKDAFLAGPEELGRNLIANVQAIVAADTGSISAAFGKITSAFIGGALDAGLEAIRSNPQVIGQGAVAGLIAGAGAVVLKKAVPALYNALATGIANKVASDIQFTIQAIRNPQQAFAGIQLAIGQVQVSIAYLAQGERKLAGDIRRFAGISVKFGQTAYELSTELTGSAVAMIKGVGGFLRSTGLVVAALKSGEIRLQDAAKALFMIEAARTGLPQGPIEQQKLLPPGRGLALPSTPGRLQATGGGSTFVIGGGIGGTFQPNPLIGPRDTGLAGYSGVIVGFRRIGDEADRSTARTAKLKREIAGINNLRIGDSVRASLQGLVGGGAFGGDFASNFQKAFERVRYVVTSTQKQTLRSGAGEAFSFLGIEQTGGIDQSKKALAQISAAYRAGVVSANDYARAQLQVAKATLDAKLPFKGLSDAVKDLGSQFGEAAKDILFYGAAYQALGALQQLPRNIYEAVKAQDSFSNTLKASLGAGDTFGQQMQYLSDLSAKYGMNLAETRDGFVKMFSSLRQANIATTDVNTLQESVAILGTAFKMSPDKLDRVTYALGQMASKGQITAEELKGQLGDVLPGAVSQFAEAAGYKGPDAIAKFSKAMEDGAFKGKAMQDILYNWALIVNRDFANAALNGKNSIQGLENQLANANTRMLESFRGGLAQVLPSIVNPLVAGLNQVSDALDLVFQNSKQRMQQLTQNQAQLKQAQKTGIAPADNLELGFRKGERVSKSDVANQLKQTEVQIDAVQLKLDGLEDNKAAQKLAQDFRNFGAAVKGFADGLSAAFSPLQKVVQSLVSISNAVTGASASTSGFVGILVGTILQVRLASGIIGFLASRFLGLVAVTKTTGTVFVGLSAVLNRVGLSFGLLNGSVTAFGLAAARGGIQARFLAAGLNLVAKAGPLLLVSGLIFFFEKIGELLDKNAKKVREFKDAIAGLGATELMSRKATLSAQLSTQKAAFANYPGGYEGYVADTRAGRNPATRIGRTQAEGLTQAAENISVTVSQLGEIENALVRDRRQQAAIRAEQQASMRDVQASMAAAEGEGKGKGGRGKGTPQAIGDDYVSLMQDLVSKTMKSALEEQKYAFQSAMERLFPRGAGIFQPFVDAYKGVFDFLADFQERQLDQSTSAVKAAVQTFRIGERDARNVSRLMSVPIRPGDVYSRDAENQRFGGARGHQGYDIGANPGTAVLAMASGTVKDIYQNFSRGAGYGGKGLVIQGDDGVTYVYGHVEGITAGIGARIAAGQRVAGVANLGDQSHLHMEMRRNGRAFDPRDIINRLYGGVRVQQGQGGMAATTLTAEQKANLKKQEEALAQQQQRTTGALLRSGMQNIFNLFSETNLADDLSKVSVSLRELKRRMEDLGFAAKGAFIDLLPEGLAESNRAILDADKNLLDARRSAEDLSLEFKQMTSQGSAVMQLFAGGINALSLEENRKYVEEINAALKSAGVGKTLADIFKEANGNASNLLEILGGISTEAFSAAQSMIAAAEAQKRVAEANAPFTQRIASLQSSARVYEAAGISGVFAGQIRQAEIDRELNKAREALFLNPEQAGSIQQQIDNLLTIKQLNHDVAGGVVTIGDLFSTTTQGFSDFTSSLLKGTSSFQEALVSLLNSFADYLIQIGLKLAAMQIFQSFFGGGGGFGSTSFGLFDLLGGGGIGGGVTGGGVVNSVLPMNFPGIAKFATGGVVTGPTLGLIGEGRYNEAVIPLPDGRSVPVELGGNTGNQVNTTITVNVNNGQMQSSSSGSAGADLGRRLEGAVKQVIANELRPGGLISGVRR